MSRYNGIRTVTNGLVFCVDAANPQSINFTGLKLTDLSNGYVGQNVNNPTFVNSGITSYVLFDGTDDAMIFNESILSKTQYTKTVWYYIASVASGSSNNIISGGADSNHYFYPAGSQWLRAGHNGLDSYQTVTSQNIGKAIQFDKWNFGAVTYSSTNGWKLYVADSLADADSSTVTFDGTQYFRLASYGGGNLLNGRIAQALIYNRVLTPFEIYQNYNATKGRYGIPDIVMGGLVLNLDAGNPYSYNPDNTGSTVWTDVSYTSSGGTMVNGTFYTGGTMQFDGVDDYVRTSYNQQLENFTICSFFKDTGSTGFARIVDKSFFDGFWFGRNGDGTNRYGGGCIQNSNYNFITLTAGQWHFLAMVRNGTSLKVYGDGITNTNTTTCGSGPISSKTLHVGATINDGFPSNPSQRDWFTGNISNVQLYNRVLTDNEILQNFNALRGRFGI